MPAKIRLDSIDSPDYMAVRHLVNTLCMQTLQKSIWQITEGDRDKKEVRKLKISGKSLVSYCKKICKGEAFSMQESTLDVMVQDISTVDVNSWEEWVILFNAETENESYPTAIVAKSIILAGACSGLLVGMLYLISQDLFHFSEEHFQKNGPRILKLWLSYLLGGAFAGWAVGKAPGILSRFHSKKVKKAGLFLLLFSLLLMAFIFIIQAADRSALLPCIPEEAGKGYLGNFNFEGLALAIYYSMALTLLISGLSYHPWPGKRQSIWMILQSILWSFIAYLSVYTTFQIIYRLGIYEYESWVIECWFTFRFEHIERIWFMIPSAFIYGLFLVHAPKVYKRLF